MDFEVNVRERILKPVNEVFDAVVDPNKMSNYFISGASGPIKAIRHQSPNGAQQEAYRRRKCNGKVPVIRSGRSQ
jgi:uncharacterized protein YndB with AHSA1/START domain